MDLPSLPTLPERLSTGDNPQSLALSSRGPSDSQFLFSEQLRGYQIELARPGVEGSNYIICAPTGSGKTAVAAFVISNHLRRMGGRGKVVFLVNKVPLAEQQKTEVQRYIKDIKIAAMTGEMSTELKTMVNNHDAVVCTAGVFVNALQESQDAARVKLKEITLLIIDECHHTKKNTPYAAIMIHYLKKKFGKKRYNLPQVVGLTATPGTGDAKIGDVVSAVDHMIKLCAHVDANRGIKTVEEEHNRAELLQHTQKTPLKMIPVPERSGDTPFFKMVISAMDKIEAWLDDRCPHPKHDQSYENWVVQKINDTRLHDHDPRNKLSALEHLRWYSVALTIYADLNEKHAIRVLEHELKPLDDRATEVERMLYFYYQKITEIGRQNPTESPLLGELKKRISSVFSENPNCQGIVFCKTKHHAACLSEWVNGEAELQRAGVRAGVVTGHIRDGNAGMNRAEQQQKIDEFRRQKLNLIIATTVLEEGFDVPACNLVIRLHVTNEIARKQAHGRARADDSQCFTILTEGSRKEYQELKNKELEKLAELAFEYLPRGKQLLEQIQPIQLSLLEDKKAEKEAAHVKKSQHDPRTVRLLCGKCKAFACEATDVKTIGFHYTVPSEAFRDKYTSRPHSKPKEMKGMRKDEKIACAKCNTDWGVQCTWNKGYKFPVLKCECFIFEISGVNHTFKQWSKITFPISDFQGPRDLLDTSSSEDSD